VVSTAPEAPTKSMSQANVMHMPYD
jgi:hypothetical protein